MVVVITSNRLYISNIVLEQNSNPYRLCTLKGAIAHTIGMFDFLTPPTIGVKPWLMPCPSSFFSSVISSNSNPVKTSLAFYRMDNGSLLIATSIVPLLAGAVIADIVTCYLCYCVFLSGMVIIC
jgi:hypothetical protein